MQLPNPFACEETSQNASQQRHITAVGTNPAASAITQANAIAVQAGNGTAETTGSISFGESVTGVSVVPSTWVAGASATYVVSFRASDEVGVGADIFLSETAEETDFTGVSGILVTDSTQAWHFVATGAVLADGSARVPLLMAVKSEDSVTMTLVGVKNPPAGTVSDFAVSTSADFVAFDAAPFTIGASAGATVSVNPSTTGSLATYVISNLYASAPMSGGSSTIALDAPTGTVFPNSPADYNLEDATTPSGSGTVSAALAGGGSNDVTLKVPNGINAGDRLTITVLDGINPSVASSTDTIGLVGPVTGPATAAVPFPHAGATYPSGAIISFSGADYVLAGGHAFAVTSPKIRAAVEKVDHAQAEAAAAGAKPSSGPPRAGTLLTTRPVNGATTVYVVGTDGELHGFASPKQFTGDGYDPALVITIPSLGGIRAGASAGAEGPAANARSTSSDGAIVDSSGMYFVFAGGRAFPVANLSQLASLRKADKAEVLSGSVGPAQENAGIASGVVLSALGPVYVSYLGNLFPFKSMGQLSGDGYGGTAEVHVPSTAGLPVVPSYTGT